MCFNFRLGSNPEKIFPYRTLHDQLRRYGKYGLACASFALPIFTNEIEKAPEFSKALNKRFRDIVADSYRLGYIWIQVLGFRRNTFKSTSNMENRNVKNSCSSNFSWHSTFFCSSLFSRWYTHIAYASTSATVATLSIRATSNIIFYRIKSNISLL